MYTSTRAPRHWPDAPAPDRPSIRYWQSANQHVAARSLFRLACSGVSAATLVKCLSISYPESPPPFSETWVNPSAPKLNLRHHACIGLPAHPICLPDSSCEMADNSGTLRRTAHRLASPPPANPRQPNCPKIIPQHAMSDRLTSHMDGREAPHPCAARSTRRRGRVEAASVCGRDFGDSGAAPLPQHRREGSRFPKDRLFAIAGHAAIVADATNVDRKTSTELPPEPLL